MEVLTPAYQVGQEVFTLFATPFDIPVQPFKGIVLATEEFGERIVYVLDCFNRDLLKGKKGVVKTWAQVSERKKREMGYTSEEEDVYPTLDAAIAAQQAVYDARIQRVEADRAAFLEAANLLRT